MAATPNATPLSGSELVAFTVAVEVGSVHGAADALGLTASAVTKRIAALERRVGATLFERGRFGLRATPAAQLLYPDAKQAIAALERAAATMAQHVGTQAQLLTIAASHTTGEFLLPEWLGAFRITTPQTRAQVDVTNSTAVVAAVRDGAVDVGFVEGRDALDGLEALTVHRDEIVVVVASQHRWARRRTVAARELRAESYITREAGSGTRAVAMEAVAAAGVELTPSLELASAQSVKRALAGGGFALLSTLAIETERQAGSLHALHLKEGGLERELQAVRRGPKARRNAAAQAFWRWLTTSPAAPN
jgi:DNA-binding transcriptional LysR family regulator